MDNGFNCQSNWWKEFMFVFSFVLNYLLEHKGTHCGVLRRHAFDFGALRCGCTKAATGHNADDMAETILMNSTLLVFLFFLLLSLNSHETWKKICKGFNSLVGYDTCFTRMGSPVRSRVEPFLFLFFFFLFFF